MKSSRPASACWRSSKTITTGAAAASRSKNVRQAPKSCSGPAALGLDPEEGEEGRLDPAPLVRVGDMRRDGLGDLATRRRLVVRLEEAGPRPDHLAEGPERDPLAVGGAAPFVPEGILGEPVDVLEELPGKPRLADPGLAGDRDVARPTLADRRVEEVLEEAQLVVAADEGGLERLRPVAAAPLRDDPQGTPGGHGGGLALEGLLPGRLEDDRRGGRPGGGLADEDRAGAGRPTGAGRPC